MYIISKHKDYYDGAVGLGIDKSIVYERKTVEENDQSKFPEPFTRRKMWRWDRSERNSFHRICNPPSTKKHSVYETSSAFIVGFCGKLYIGWKFYHEVQTPNSFFPEEKVFITYDLDFVKNELEEYSWTGKLKDDLNYISSYNPMEIFRLVNSPIFIYDTDYERTSIRRYSSNIVFITNPILKNYEFYKVIDSYTAFQEIQMFLSGVLGTGEKEVVEIEDKYKITQHGFDKYSFRRSKANGKKRPQSKR